MNYGIVLFRAADLQDIYNSLAVLQMVAHLGFQLNLFMLSETLDLITTETTMASMNPANSSFWPKIVPEHTFAEEPDLDVLIVPGGPGVRAPDTTVLTNYIARTYPSLQYLITICTGAGLAAKSGVLNGRRATTNKKAWAEITKMGPLVKWVSPARWVVDGNIWTSSGVSLGHLRIIGRSVP